MSDADTATAADEATTEAAHEPERCYGQLVTRSRGQLVLHVARAELADVVRGLRDDEGFNVCIDVTAVDYLTATSERDLPDGMDPERFEVVVTLRSHANRQILRLRVQVPESEPDVPSIFDVHPGSENLEREVYDMFGIRFTGHPDLTRILMPEDWIGHPLRKDYSTGRIPVQFKGVVNER